tara:strand:+ start:383 stop:712 length:330 start_codon:yes stop_codon:yes gene_type:complete
MTNLQIKAMKLKARRTAEAYVFYATLASGIQHFLTMLEYDPDDDVVHVKVQAETKTVTVNCDGCGEVHKFVPPLPSELGFDIDNPPLPTPDTIFKDPAPPPHVLKPFLN